MILVDSSVIIEIIEGRPFGEQCRRALAVCPVHEWHVSAVSVFEVEAGLFAGSPDIRARRAAWALFTVGTVPCIVHDDVAELAASIVRETAAAGGRVGALDALIAASAIHEGLTLVTLDRDFLRVGGLRMELWR